MKDFFRRVISLIISPQPVPAAYRRNFINLYLDVAWFGILNGSILSFLVIYATRLGASGLQIGLVNAGPAIMTLIFALPAGTWLARRPIRGGVYWSAMVFRMFYLLLIPLPTLLAPYLQIWAIIGITLVMSVPGTALSVGFNALFAEAVPIEWRGHVAGIRNAVLALSSTITALACGYILTHLSFQFAYQVVFALGFAGAILSTIAVGAIHPVSAPIFPGEDLQANGPDSDVNIQESTADSTFLQKVLGQLRLDILKGPFALTIFLLFLFHLGQYLAIPIFPLYQVNVLHFSDQIISFGSGLFNILTFLGSLRLEGVVRKLGNQKVMAFGIMMLSLYPALFSITHGVGLYIIASIVGGLAWALVGGVLYNYLLEKVPAYDRPAHLAWYTLGFNAAVLLGSLIGPALAAQIGLTAALIVFAACRFCAGLAILKWG